MPVGLPDRCFRLFRSSHGLLHAPSFSNFLGFLLFCYGLQVEKFIQQEREKLGLTEAEYDIEVDKTVTGNIPNFQQYVKSQK